MRALLALVLFGTSCAAATRVPAPAGSDCLARARYGLALRDVRLGVVTVWSRGVVPARASGQDSVQVTLLVDDTGDEPLVILVGQMQLDLLLGDPPRRSGPLVVTDFVGHTIVRRDTSGTLEVEFRLPEGVSADQVVGYELRWALHASGESLAGLTPFFSRRGRPSMIPLAHDGLATRDCRQVEQSGQLLPLSR
jgi:hypothetical protein